MNNDKREEISAINLNQFTKEELRDIFISNAAKTGAPILVNEKDVDGLNKNFQRVFYKLVEEGIFIKLNEKEFEKAYQELSGVNEIKKHLDDFKNTTTSKDDAMIEINFSEKNLLNAIKKTLGLNNTKELQEFLAKKDDKLEIAENNNSNKNRKPKM